MTSPTALLHRAAELVIAFGLDDAGTTPAAVLAAAADGTILVAWRLPSVRAKRPMVELTVFRRTDGIETRTSVETGGLGAQDARLAMNFARRVVTLAENIEALR